MDDHNKSSNWLRILLAAFFSRMRFVLIATGFCALTAILSSYLLPEVYTGGFSILIKSPEIDNSVIGERADVSFRPGGIDDKVIADEFHILRSDGLAGAVADTYGTNTPLPRGYLQSALPAWLSGGGKLKSDKTAASRRESMIAYIQESMVVTPQRKSDIITVTARSHDRAFLEKLLSLYASQYLNYRKTIWFTQEAQQFFGDQAKSSLEEWTSLSEELLAKKSSLNSIDPRLEKIELEKHISSNLARLQVLQVQAKQQATQLVSLDELDPQDAITFFNDQTKENRLFWKLKADIGGAKASRQELLKNHMKDSPLVRKANLQLDGLYHEYKNLIRSLIKNSLTLLEAERTALISSNRDSSDRVLKLGRITQSIDVLEKKIALFERQYEMYETRAMSTKADRQSRNALGTAVRIVSPPTVRSAAIWPKRIVLTLVAAGLGFFLSLIAITVLWIIKDAFRFPEDVSQYLDLPVLTSFVLENKTTEPDELSTSGPRPGLPFTGGWAISLPGSRSLHYSLLVFVGMVVAGWVIGTTLWSVPWSQDKAIASSRNVVKIAKPALDTESTANASYTIKLPLVAQKVSTPEAHHSSVFIEQDTPQTRNNETADENVAPMENQLEIKNSKSMIMPIETSEETIDAKTTAADIVQVESLKSTTANKAESEDSNTEDSVKAESKLGPNISLAVFSSPVKIAGPGDETPDIQSATDSKETHELNGMAETSTLLAEKEDSTGSEQPASAETDHDNKTQTEKQSAKGKNTANKYFVQFGSYQDEAKALELRDKLAAQGYSVRVPVVSSRISGKTWHSVRADFSDPTQANEARDKFFAEEGIQPVLGKNR